MGFGNALRTTKNNAPALPGKSSLLCIANGCPMPGSISGSGAGFVCFIHHSTDGADWPRATESILQNERIRLAIIETARIDDVSWWRGQWRILDGLFDDEPALQPTEAERQQKSWYEYRLRDWLAYYAGAIPKAPAPRKALPQQTRRGPSMKGI